MRSPSPRPGDRVHVSSIGTGIVKEVRNGGRCVVEIKGRAVLVAASQLQPAESAPRTRPESTPASPGPSTEPPSAAMSLDLHGKSVLEAIDALDVFLSDAVVAGAESVRVIHGRSGGRVKRAVHKRLEQLPSIRAFRIDPMNPGVTIVSF